MCPETNSFKKCPKIQNTVIIQIPDYPVCISVGKGVYLLNGAIFERCPNAAQQFQLPDTFYILKCQKLDFLVKHSDG